MEWFCYVKLILPLLESCSEGGWYTENLILHQVPAEFVRQNFRWLLSRRSLSRELLIILLQETSESSWAASGISVQESSVSQSLWDKENGLQGTWISLSLSLFLFVSMSLPVIGWGTRHPSIICRHKGCSLKGEGVLSGINPEYELWWIWRKTRQADNKFSTIERNSASTKKRHRIQEISYLQHTQTQSLFPSVLLPPSVAYNLLLRVDHTSSQPWGDKVAVIITVMEFSSRNFSPLVHLPVLCHPGVPDTLGRLVIRSLPETLLEHRVVGNRGLQTAVGCILS